MKGYELPCDARMADGAARGAALGLLWSAWFGPSEVWCSKATMQLNAARLARTTGGYTLGFSAFLACYNGIFCCCERQFGGESVVSPIVSGGMVGMGVGAFISPLRAATVLSTSGMCAGMCGVCHWAGVGRWKSD